MSSKWASPVSFTGIRRPAALAGIWDVGGAVDTVGPEWSFRLRHDGARWVATRSGSDTEERPLLDFYVRGSSISFFIVAGDGTARRIAYHGLVDGDRVFGFVRDGGELVPWSAHRRGYRP